MKAAESLEQFYQKHSLLVPNSEVGFTHSSSGKFNVYPRSDFSCKNFMTSNRRDYYKISLIIGKGILNYADRSIEISSNALLFSNPNIPYGWEATSVNQKGFFCVFTEDFLLQSQKDNGLSDSPLFKIGGNPVFFLEEKSIEFLTSLYEKMIIEVASAYVYKYELLRNYVHLIIHEALKWQPATTFLNEKTGNFRIASLFSELLERQFPIDSQEHSLTLKTPNDYAVQLAIHTNHLNRAVKNVTGKTTTILLAERIIKEAKALLMYTNWNVAEVAYCLGFDEPAYFNNQFKKYTNTTPSRFRQTCV